MTRSHKMASFVSVCAAFLLGGTPATLGAEKRPISRQELDATLSPLQAQRQEAYRRLVELEKRSQALLEEVKSPDRKRSVKEIGAELDAVLKEHAKENKRFRDAAQVQDRAVLALLKSRSVVIGGTGMACGVAEQLYPGFLGSLDPKKAAGFPPQILYEADGSTVSLRKLLNGETEAAALDRPLTGEEKAALRKAFPNPRRQPQEVVFFRAATVVVVHQGNRLRALTTDQVKQIYQAEIEKWSAVGGLERSIVRLGTRPPLLSCWVFTDRILHGKAVRFPDEFKFDPNHLPKAEEVDRLYKEQRGRFPGGGPFARYETDAKLMEAVAKKSNAIGYCILFPSNDQMKNVRLVPIAKAGEEPVPPVRDGVLSDAYPLQEQVWLLVHPDAPESTRAFVEFACGPKAAKTVKQCGLWPECELQPVYGQQRLAEVKAGGGTPIKLCDLTGRRRLLDDLAGDFVKAKAAVQLGVQRGDAGSQDIAAAFKAGSDLLLTDRPMPTGKQESGGKGRGAEEQKSDPTSPKSVVLGRMAVGIIVHPKNPLDALPLDEVQGIFGGEIRQWPGAQGAAGTMHVHGLLYTDTIAQLLEEKIKPMALKHRTEADSAKVVLEVAKDPMAIGFVDLSQLSPDEKSVKVVGVYLPGQAKPAEGALKAEGGKGKAEGGARKEEATTGGRSSTVDPQSLRSRPVSLAAYRLPEDYPLVRTFTLCVSPKASETAKDFVRFVVSDRCATTLVKHNLLPSSRQSIDRETAAPAKPQKPDLGNKP